MYLFILWSNHSENAFILSLSLSCLQLVPVSACTSFPWKNSEVMKLPVSDLKKFYAEGVFDDEDEAKLLFWKQLKLLVFELKGEKMLDYNSRKLEITRVHDIENVSSEGLK